MKCTSDDLIHAFKLFFVTKLNFAELQCNGDDKLQKDLMVKIFDQKAGEVFTFFFCMAFAQCVLSKEKTSVPINITIRLVKVKYLTNLKGLTFSSAE